MVHGSQGAPVVREMPATCLTPLRWAGGKRKLVPLLKQAVPRHVARIIEPFFGGGSVSLGVPSTSACGSDTNGELVNFFAESASHGQDIIAVLSGWPDNRDTYLEVRALSPSTDIERAARFAFLNRTGYFGLYRTNQQGRYNVPYGGGGRLNLEAFAEAMEALAPVMRRVSVEHVDYLSLMSRVAADDVVFLDPPYGAAGDFPFRRYGSLLFSPSDHRRLAAEAERCRRLGATVIVTLPADHSLLGLYQGWSVFAERRRGGKLLETCLTTDIPAGRDLVSSGEWRVPARNRSVGEVEGSLRTGTDEF